MYSSTALIIITTNRIESNLLAYDFVDDNGRGKGIVTILINKSDYRQFRPSRNQNNISCSTVTMRIAESDIR